MTLEERAENLFDELGKVERELVAAMERRRNPGGSSPITLDMIRATLIERIFHVLRRVEGESKAEARDETAKYQYRIVRAVAQNQMQADTFQQTLNHWAERGFEPIEFRVDCVIMRARVEPESEEDQARRSAELESLLAREIYRDVTPSL